MEAEAVQSLLGEGYALHLHTFSQSTNPGQDQVRQQPPACRIRASARPHALPPLAAPASAAPRWQAVTHAMIWLYDLMARALCRIHPSQVTRAVTTGSSWFPAQPIASSTEPQAAPPA